jgi:hypothetical protein
MKGNKILEKLTVQDFNTPHSCDYRHKDFPDLTREDLKARIAV